MARPLKLEFAGALYHVTARGDRQENIYEGDSDRVAFLDVLGDVCAACNWVCHAYCSRSAREWPWGSYRATAGQVNNPDWLEVDWLLAMFGRKKKTAIEGYKRFVSEGKGQPSPWKDLRNQVYLGDPDFVSQLQGLIDGDKELSEVPMSQRRPKPSELGEYEAKASSRDEAIYLAYMSGGYTLKEIGDYFSLHYARVSQIVKKAKSKT